MTREEAITWFENRAKQITLSGAREMYRLAISALRELDEYKKAEAEGRLVILPCKVGDTVYRFQRYFNDATLKSEIKIKPCVVGSFSSESIITTDHVWILVSNFGKTVFLTREEAEKALEGNNGQKR